jgi:hypothetical protein
MGLGDAIHDFFSSGKGLIRLAADRAFATGVWSALPTASIDFRGALARTEGGGGVNDALRFAEKDTADAYRWALIPTLPTDPGADRIAFWDESDNAFRYLTVDATDFAISGTTLSLGDAPSVSDLTNFQHDHGDADDGGTLLPAAMPALGLVLIDDSDFSAAATVSRDGVFSATYENYLIVVGPYASSGAVSLQMRLRAGGVDNSTGTNYYWGLSNISSAAAHGLGGGAAANEWRFLSTGAAITEAHGCYWISTPFITQETTFSGTYGARHATASITGTTGGMHDEAASYDGFTLFPPSGNITGTVRTYGLRG